MEHYSKSDIVKMVEEEDVEFIRLQFTDIFGSLKNVAVTTSQLEKVLNNQCVFDGSSIESFASIGESDMYLHPELDTFVIFPWRPQSGKVARFICDIYKPDGTPFEGSPRYILKKTIEEAEKLGYELKVGPECEFFLFDLGEDGEVKAQTKESGGYFDVSPLDSGENARREMVLMLEQMGFTVESSFHEEANGQHEIDFKYSDAMSTADNIMTFKMAVRTIARRHGMHATFMPKPNSDKDGSGMHINLSIEKSGRNIFAAPDMPYGLSSEAMSFMAGLISHVDEITAVTNPLVNSYKRLVPGFNAPVYESWSTSNSTSMIRIPAPRGESTRIELRSPDPAANPYLAIAVCLAAGIDGINKNLKAPEMLNINPDSMNFANRQKYGVRNLPGTLYEALRLMEGSPLVKKVMGERIFDNYIEAKKKEWRDYSTQVSEWETAHYLNRF